MDQDLQNVFHDIHTRFSVIPSIPKSEVHSNLPKWLQLVGKQHCNESIPALEKQESQSQFNCSAKDKFLGNYHNKPMVIWPWRGYDSGTSTTVRYRGAWERCMQLLGVYVWARISPNADLCQTSKFSSSWIISLIHLLYFLQLESVNTNIFKHPNSRPYRVDGLVHLEAASSGGNRSKQWSIQATVHRDGVLTSILEPCLNYLYFISCLGFSSLGRAAFRVVWHR